MAVEVAKGYVTISPKVVNAKAEISRQLGAAAKSAGEEAGRTVGAGISKGAASGASEAGRSVRSELSSAARSAGADAGREASEGLRKAFSEASDDVALGVWGRLDGVFSKVTGSLRGIASGASESASWVKGVYGTALGEVGDTIRGSSIGKAFSSIATGATGAAAKVTGAFRGVGLFLTEAFGGAARGIGAALKGVAATASGIFSAVKGVASTAASAVGAAFKGIASVVGPALGGIGSALKSAFSAVAKVAAPAVAAVGGAVGAIGVSALEAFGDFEQLSQGIQLGLGEEVWATVEARSKDAFRNVQMSQNDYLQRVNLLSTGLRESLGGDAQAAADLADKVITAQADIVAAKGIDPQTVSDVFMSVSRGMYQTLDSLGLGISGTKEGMQDVIDKANEWRVAQGKAGDLTIDSMADCQQALVDYVDYLGMSGYAADEGARTVQGSISKMKGAWTDWVAELGKGDGDMSRVSQNLSESFQDVARNVKPVFVAAVGNIFRELPGVVATVGPVDEATGGMATRALEFAAPITDALRGAFDGIGEWLGENEGPLSEIGGKLAELGGQLSEALGGAIEAAGPIVAGFADVALPALSSALDFASGELSMVSEFASAFCIAIKPLADAIGPVAAAVGGALCDALSDLGGWLGSLDFEGFATKVSEVLQGVVDFAQGAVENISGFFSDVATFLADPLGTIQAGFEGMIESARNTESSVASSFDGVASSVGVGVGSAMADIGAYNGTELAGKEATAEVTGNVPGGGAASDVKDTTKATDGLYSKTVTVTANGNGASGTAASNIWSLSGAISSIYSKTVDIVTNHITRNVTQSAAGHVFARHADGIIATRPLLTSVGLVGEAGAEAIVGNQDYTGVFPLTNRKYTGPFSNEISDQVVEKLGRSGDTYNISVTAGDGASDIVLALRRELRAIQLTREGR